jgi:hypothetical protein
VRATALVLAVCATRAAAEGEDPRVLFASGRYAAAAQVFEHRWQASGDAVDGINAVVSWRTAGRYARAVGLLARVRSGKQPPTGDALATADELDRRLASLTATLSIANLPRTAVIQIDADPAELVGGAIVLDVGEHDVAIAQEGCDPFVAHETAFPGAKLEVRYEPHCDRRGTLHVYLDGDPDGAFAIDGQPHTAAGHDANVALEPGPHRLEVAAGERPVLSRDVVIDAKQTTTVRVRYPWRARRTGFIFAATSETRAGQVMDGTGGGLTIGLWSSQFRLAFDAGSMISDTPGLRPASTGPGHPWVAGTFALHLWRGPLGDGPLWHRRAGSYELQLDFDPIAARFEEIRGTSFFGFRAKADETRVRALSVLPVALSIDGPYIHLEVTWWPISYATYHEGGSMTIVQPGVSTLVTILAGWRL